MENNGETYVVTIVINSQELEAPLFGELRKKFSIKPFLIRKSIHIKAVGFLETYAAGHNVQKIHTKSDTAKSTPASITAIMAKCRHPGSNSPRCN